MQQYKVMAARAGAASPCLPLCAGHCLQKRLPLGQGTGHWWVLLLAEGLFMVLS